MTLTIQPISRLPSEDRMVRRLFAEAAQPFSADSLFPGGPLGSMSHLEKRLAFLNKRQWNWDLMGKWCSEGAPEDGWHPAQLENLAAVRQGKALFVLTGQQPGLAGGPVLWLYKALSAVAWARRLSADTGHTVVPLFWIAGDDSDLRECGHIELLESGYHSNLTSALEAKLPDGSLRLPVALRSPEDALQGMMPTLRSAWGNSWADFVSDCYSQGASFSTGFRRIAQRFLGAHGVLFVDGYSETLSRLSVGMLRNVITRWRDFERGVDNAKGRLAKAGFTAQVHTRPGAVHAFALGPQGRERLWGRVSATGPEVVVDPEFRLSHDVLSRPLVADEAMPILGHILGPAELRYFGMLGEVFLEFTGSMPMVHPRMQAAALPMDAIAGFGKEGLAPENLFGLRPSDLRRHLVERAWREFKGAQALEGEDSPRMRFQVELEAMHQKLFPGQRAPMETMMRSLQKPWGRYLDSVKRMHYKASAQPHLRLMGHLRWAGEGRGQDRHLNLFSLLAQLGEDGLKGFLEELDAMRIGPQLVGFG